jgi:hypothetical protein
LCDEVIQQRRFGVDGVFEGSHGELPEDVEGFTEILRGTNLCGETLHHTFTNGGIVG